MTIPPPGVGGYRRCPDRRPAALGGALRGLGIAIAWRRIVGCSLAREAERVNWCEWCNIGERRSRR